MLTMLRRLSAEAEWQLTLSQIESGFTAQRSVANFVRSLGLNRGVSGYSLHVVAVAVYSWLRHPGDFRSALTAVLDCGGDTDTVGAILGALMGASVGAKGIPAEWLGAIWEWPRSVTFMRRVAVELAGQAGSPEGAGQVRYFWPATIPRNLLFMAAVLAHGLRRLAPPF